MPPPIAEKTGPRANAPALNIAALLDASNALTNILEGASNFSTSASLTLAMSSLLATAKSVAKFAAS